MTIYTRLDRAGADTPVGVRLETLRGARLAELAEAFEEASRMIARDPSVIPLPEVRLIRQVNRQWQRSRSRIIVEVVEVMVIAILSVAVGYWLGSGGVDSRSRYNAERMAAQRGESVEYGPADIYRYRRAAAAEWELLMRQLEMAERDGASRR